MFVRTVSAFLVISLLAVTLIPAEAEEAKPLKIAQYLQNVSVTVRTDRGSGSGVLVQTKDGQVWVWTAAHVVASLRRTREVLDDKGGKRTAVEFDDAKILRFNKDKDEGRIVGSFSVDAQVIRYSSSDFGNDLALLRLRDKDFKPLSSTKFYLNNDIPDVGEDLLHCGSLLGPFGSNSVTGGLMSQHGRVLDGKIYDQTTATSFPGSSGGIVCLKSDGSYVGMLVMGAGEGFGLIVPVRRMKKWSHAVGVDFALDPAKEIPTDEVLFSKPIEDSGAGGGNGAADKHGYKDRTESGLKFMLYDDRDPLAKPSTMPKWFSRIGMLWQPEDK